MMFTIFWFFLLLTASRSHQNSFVRKFECFDEQCQRINVPSKFNNSTQLNSNEQFTTLESCRLVCGSVGGLWPIPTGIFSIGKKLISINIDKINSNIDKSDLSIKPYLYKILEIFKNNIKKNCGLLNCENGNYSIIINIKVENNCHDLNWNTREDYNLEISTKDTKVRIFINSQTIYGARHALETLSQLFAPSINSNNLIELVVIDNAKIQDKPMFTHRGLLIDTARNYLPVDAILRTIDGLGSTKMNVLHWHATDTQSFPLKLQSQPLMSIFGAYSQEMTYSPEEIEKIKLHAKHRGVRIIIEIDTPSHAGSGWQWGPTEGLGNLAVCVDKEPWRKYCIQPPCGQLNPVNENTFDVLKDIYNDVLSIMGNDSILHLGGDEVYLPCWNSTEEIVTEMKARGMGTTTDDFFKLWSEFHSKQLGIIDDLKKNNDSVIIWSSGLTLPDVIDKYLNKSRFVIQTWLESSSTVPNELLNKGYKLIISTKDAWYLDHGFWGVTKYHSWRDAYQNRIPKSEGVLGGEVCMWGEYVNEGGLDSRVWPRAAAVGERLWSNPASTMTTGDAEPRLQAHRERLEKYGIHADAMTPAWCAQHAKKCF
ncbi:hypothetical protein HCN44_008584 [Aphidius gifuensis]|uniref:Beta-hexosaminidase n=1 Tax=Aphidius gifuensis TaxID=684658 RepID=A0A834XMR5_APHGI|nr:chitooligosaccharidolytic beta-N-acetylglucosaminidase [Aphidius gifuensis]KAF7989910.1 hypothetical protein HCN44_008584 [Aphidius gifuensis]